MYLDKLYIENIVSVGKLGLAFPQRDPVKTFSFGDSIPSQTSLKNRFQSFPSVVRSPMCVPGNPFLDKTFLKFLQNNRVKIPPKMFQGIYNMTLFNHQQLSQPFWPRHMH